MKLTFWLKHIASTFRIANEAQIEISCNFFLIKDEMLKKWSFTYHDGTVSERHK